MMRTELEQLRAEREALTLQVEEQRRLLELRIQQLELQRDHWQTQYMTLLEFSASNKAMQTPVIYLGVNKGTYQKGEA